MDKDTKLIWESYSRPLNESEVMVGTFMDRINQAGSVEDLEKLKAAAVQATEEYSALDSYELDDVLNAIEDKIDSFKEPEKKRKGFFGKLFGGKEEEDDDIEDTHKDKTPEQLKDSLRKYALMMDWSDDKKHYVNHASEILYQEILDNDNLRKASYLEMYQYLRFRITEYLRSQN